MFLLVFFCGILSHVTRNCWRVDVFQQVSILITRAGVYFLATRDLLFTCITGTFFSRLLGFLTSATANLDDDVAQTKKFVIQN